MGFLTAGGHDFRNVLHGCNGTFRWSAANDDANFVSSNRYLAGQSGMLRHAYGFHGLKARVIKQRLPIAPSRTPAQCDLVMSTGHVDRKCVDIRNDVDHSLGYSGRG